MVDLGTVEGEGLEGLGRLMGLVLDEHMGEVAGRRGPSESEKEPCGLDCGRGYLWFTRRRLYDPFDPSTARPNSSVASSLNQPSRIDRFFTQATESGRFLSAAVHGGADYENVDDVEREGNPDHSEDPTADQRKEKERQMEDHEAWRELHKKILNGYLEKKVPDVGRGRAAQTRLDP
ncbi:MAG: hypothetical protein M1830_003156 [Pleopsidium flavum]|nr:MAG: hypothetical protein M1830_003156 [Pleopsidium flavum]